MKSGVVKMMGKRIFLLFAALLTVIPAAHAELKIGYVNAARLLDESPQAEDVSKRLKQEFSGKEKDLRSKQDRLKKMQDRMTRDGSIMSESEHSKLNRDILNLQRDVQRKSDEFREDLNLRKNEEMNKLLGVIQAAIEQIGKEQHYDLIVYEGVAYASHSIDLTDQVLDKLRAEMKTSGSASAPKK
ncbi:MAG: OmpH family outer membrane protein [Gammaproteobacteria bacterium]|jgi:outer membrane protein